MEEKTSKERIRRSTQRKPGLAVVRGGNPQSHRIGVTMSALGLAGRGVGPEEVGEKGALEGSIT